MRHSSIAKSTAVALTATITTLAHAQCSATVYGHADAGDGSQDAWYGSSVDAVDGRVIIGARQSTGLAGMGEGAAYIRTRTPVGWTESKLLADESAPWDTFGCAVAIGDDIAFVGAEFDDNDAGFNAGTVFVFEFDGFSWAQTDMLVASDGAGGDQFGHAIALDGDRLLIGAPFAGPSGAAYVFERSGSIWGEAVKLLPDATTFDSRFGSSVDMKFGLMLVGAPNDGTISEPGRGAAYAFLLDQFSDEWIGGRLADDHLNPHDAAGTSVALAGHPDTAVMALVGAPESLFAGSGSVHVHITEPFAIGTLWEYTIQISPSDASAGLDIDRFGSSLAAENDVILVGAPADNTPDGDTAGSVYMIRHTPGTMTWIETRLRAPDAATGDQFGSAVAFTATGADSGIAVMGAYQQDVDTTNDGGAYVLDDLLADCDNNGTLDLCDIAGGLADDNQNGQLDICETCEGDADGNLVVNVDDLITVVLNFDSMGAPGIPGDVTLDGVVDVDDLVTVILLFDSVC